MVGVSNGRSKQAERDTKNRDRHPTRNATSRLPIELIFTHCEYFASSPLPAYTAEQVENAESCLRTKVSFNKQASLIVSPTRLVTLSRVLLSY